MVARLDGVMVAQGFGLHCQLCATSRTSRQASSTVTASNLGIGKGCWTRSAGCHRIPRPQQLGVHSLQVPERRRDYIPESSSAGVCNTCSASYRNVEMVRWFDRVMFPALRATRCPSRYVTTQGNSIAWGRRRPRPAL